MEGCLKVLKRWSEHHKELELITHDVADAVDDRDVQGVTATQLGSSAIKASVERAGIEADQVEE